MKTGGREGGAGESEQAHVGSGSTMKYIFVKDMLRDSVPGGEIHRTYYRQI